MTSSPHFAETLDQVQPEPIRWIWEHYLPRGKLALLDGDPGVGKSMLTLNLAARLSNGGFMPDGWEIGRPHTTIILSGEDRIADTIRPRAEAAGADLSRIVTISSTDGTPLRFPTDLATLEEVIRSRRAEFVVIDPVMAFLPPEVATSSDQCIREVFGKFAMLAGRTDCTILLVRHLRKLATSNALHRGLGSIGIIGSVRAGLMASHHPTTAGLNVLAVTKTNLAMKPPSIGYRVVTDNRGRMGIEWTGPLELSADALGIPIVVPLRPRDHAADWLLSLLATGPRKVNDVYADVRGVGIPDRTLVRAKEDSGVKSHLVHFKNGDRVWFWYDPGAPWPKNAPFRQPEPILPPLDGYH